MSTGTVRPPSELFAEPRPIEALGDLWANIWQVCYVTPDLDRGMAEVRDLLGVENATEVPVEGATFMKGGEEVEWEPRVAMGARGGLIVELIEPVAHAHTARALGLSHPMQLSGLYQGIPLHQQSVSQSGALPERVTLYSRPILAEWQGTRHSLEHEVKAITYHGLRVERTEDGWLAEVIVDI